MKFEAFMMQLIPTDDLLSGSVPLWAPVTYYLKNGKSN